MTDLPVPAARRQLATLDQLAAIPEEEVWLAKQKSRQTRRAYRLDVRHFMRSFRIEPRPSSCAPKGSDPIRAATSLTQGAALKAIGLLAWQRRIVRNGPCVDQISNSYMLLTPDRHPSGGQSVRQTLKIVRSIVQPELPWAIIKSAREKLAEVAAIRMQKLGLKLEKF